MRPEFCDELTSSQVPEVDRSVRHADRKPSPVRRKGHRTRMVFKRSNVVFAVRSEIPKPEPPIISRVTTKDQATGIGRKSKVVESRPGIGQRAMAPGG